MFGARTWNSERELPLAIGIDLEREQARPALGVHTAAVLFSLSFLTVNAGKLRPDE